MVRNRQVLLIDTSAPLCAGSDFPPVPASGSSWRQAFRTRLTNRGGCGLGKSTTSIHMKRLITPLLCLVTLAVIGCSTTTVERTEPDGTKFRATNRRALWKSQGVAVNYTRNGSNVTATATLDQSGSDSATAKAIAEGVAAGLKSAGVIAAP